MTFDYSGFEPMDEHGSRFMNRTRKDDYGLRMQVAGPWRKEGCRGPSKASFQWMKILVFRRDEGKCQSCGVTVRYAAKGSPEVQHIIPRSVIAAEQYPGQDFYYETTNYLTRRTTKVPHAWYVNAGSCGHNLVLLCRACHVRTFSTGYGGVPVLPRRLDAFAEAGT